MRKIWIIALALASLGSSAFGVDFRRAQPYRMEDVFDASCRVMVRGAAGSGTFVGVAEDSPNVARILTNYHVVTNEVNVTVDFWTNGEKQTIKGQVVKRAYDANMPADFAIIAVDANELKRVVDPPFVALGGRDARPSANAFFLSCGGPKGWAVKAWKGKTLGYYSGQTAVFQPHPVPGQSGSGIFEVVDGELFQTGIVTWILGREGDDSAQGGAIPIANLYRSMQGGPVSQPVQNTSPIPPGARECASYTALYFRRDNCSACDAVAQDVSRVGELLPLEVVDTGTKAGYQTALEYAITELPTLLIMSGTTPKGVVSYSEMKATSLYDATVVALQKVKSEDAIASTPLPTPMPSEPKPLAIEQINSEWTLVDPLTRPAVYETLDRENAGLLDDSDRRWNLRGRNAEPEQPQEEPKQDAGGVLDRLGDQIGGIVEERVRGGLEGQIQQIEDRVSETVKTAIRRNLFRIAFFIVAMIWIANVFGAAIKSCLCWIGRKIKNMIVEAAYNVNDTLKEKFK